MMTPLNIPQCSKLVSKSEFVSRHPTLGKDDFKRSKRCYLVKGYKIMSEEEKLQEHKVFYLEKKEFHC